MARLAAEGWEEDVIRMSEERKASFMLLPDAYIQRDLTNPRKLFFFCMATKENDRQFIEWEKIRGVMFGFMQDIRDAHRRENSEKALL